MTTLNNYEKLNIKIVNKSQIEGASPSVVTNNGDLLIIKDETIAISDICGLQSLLDTYITDAPNDGSSYVRNNGQWVLAPAGGQVNLQNYQGDINLKSLEGKNVLQFCSTDQTINIGGCNPINLRSNDQINLYKIETDPLTLDTYENLGIQVGQSINIGCEALLTDPNTNNKPHGYDVNVFGNNISDNVYCSYLLNDVQVCCTNMLLRHDYHGFSSLQLYGENVAIQGSCSVYVNSSNSYLQLGCNTSCIGIGNCFINFTTGTIYTNFTKPTNW